MSDETSFSSQINKFNNESSGDTAPAELVAVVDDLLNQLNSKFSNLSSEMIGKMDEMTKRLDNLEATILAGNTDTEGEDEK